MYKTYVIIAIIVYQNFHQCTTNDQQHNITTLQPHNVTTEQPKPKPKPISCGIEYLKETIGLSITNKHLYQFLLINETIEVIKYEYRKSIRNNDYKLNLIDGQMLANGLEDLIPSNIVEQLMTVIDWNDDGRHHHSDDDNEPPPIINCAMSINKNEKIHIFCIKSFDQIKYYGREYIQEIDSNKVERFFGSHDPPQIRCTISNENQGIITTFYSKLSYRFNVIKLKENSCGKIDRQYTLVVNSSLNFLYQLNERPNEQQEQILTESFGEIFGPHTFTYGFVDDNQQIYLFSNQDEKLISFTFNFTHSDDDYEQKYPFKLQSYQDFFHCNRPLDPIKIDDNKHKKHNVTDVHNEPDKEHEEHDDHNVNRKHNKFKEFIYTNIILIIIASIIIFILLIGLFVYGLRKDLVKKYLEKLPLTSSPKQQIKLDGKSDSTILSSPTTATMTEKSISASSSISKTPAGIVSGKSSIQSSKSKTPPTTTSNVMAKPTMRSSMSKIPMTSKVSGKSLPLSSILKTPPTTSNVMAKPTMRSSMSKMPITSKVSGKLLPVSSISKTPKIIKKGKM